MGDKSTSTPGGGDVEILFELASGDAAVAAPRGTAWKRYFKSIGHIIKDRQQQEQIVHTGYVVAKSGTYTIVDTDRTVTGNTTGGAFTITLPTAGGRIGKTFTIKRISATANNLTVGTTGGETIDGAATFVLTAQWKYVTVQSDGGNWLVVANN